MLDETMIIGILNEISSKIESHEQKIVLEGARGFKANIF